MTTLELLNKLSNEVSFMEKHNLNTHIWCITLNLKCLEKVRKAIRGALINFSFKVSKAFVWSIPHLNSTLFLTNSFERKAIVLKFGKNLL